MYVLKLFSLIQFSVDTINLINCYNSYNLIH
nr:MAG TPA: hypothetical protein [Caudoviricetes sp.]DAW34558.1 MAG TPA: hypothetical protein [Caudoviricetes sp.]